MNCLLNYDHKVRVQVDFAAHSLLSVISGVPAAAPVFNEVLTLAGDYLVENGTKDLSGVPGAAYRLKNGVSGVCKFLRSASQLFLADLS